MDEKVEDLLSRMTFNPEEGTVFLEDARMSVFSLTWMVEVQKRMEETLGYSGSYSVFADAARVGGKALGKELAQQLELKSIKDLLEQYFSQFATRGFGNGTIIEMERDPFYAKVRFENSASKQIEDAEKDKCYIWYTGVEAIIQTLLEEQQDFEGKIRANEPQCVAQGAEHCIWEFKEE